MLRMPLNSTRHSSLPCPFTESVENFNYVFIYFFLIATFKLLQYTNVFLIIENAKKNKMVLAFIYFTDFYSGK